METVEARILHTLVSCGLGIALAWIITEIKWRKKGKKNKKKVVTK